jgi:hypothetical protein
MDWSSLIMTKVYRTFHLLIGFICRWHYYKRIMPNRQAQTAKTFGHGITRGDPGCFHVSFKEVVETTSREFDLMNPNQRHKNRSML